MKLRSIWSGVFVVWGLSLFSVTGLATTFVNRPLADVVNESAYIVRGRGGDSFSDWGKTESKAVYTYTWFTVTEVLKGDLKESRILLRQPGGSKDGMEMNVPGTAHFAPDEDIVVMLGKRNDDDNSYDVPGFTTGKYNIVAGENGEPVLVNSLGGGEMYDPNKDRKTLSYNSKIPLEVFRRISHGEDIPEAAHSQFQKSAKPEPALSMQAPQPRETAGAPVVSPIPTPEAVIDDHSSRSLWVPISFALLALVGVWLMWRMLKG